MTDEEPPFAVKLRGDANLEPVLCAHLHAEQLLFKMLTAGLHDPTVLDLDRLAFSTKARLAVAMGLMSSEVLGPLTALNKIRNNYAHKADYQFTDADKRDLLNSMPDYALELLLTASDGTVLHTRDDVPLEYMLRVLVCIIESKRQNFIRNKEAEEAALKRLRELIDKTDKVLGRTDKPR